jgi:hypothetical protein
VGKNAKGAFLLSYGFKCGFPARIINIDLLPVVIWLTRINKETESSDYESVQAFIGVDVGKDTHHAVAVDRSGNNPHFYL